MGSDKGKIDTFITDFGLSRIIGPGAVLSRTFKAIGESLLINSPYFSAKLGTDSYLNPPIETTKLNSLNQSFLQNYAFLAPEQKKEMPSK